MKLYHDKMLRTAVKGYFPSYYQADVDTFYSLDISHMLTNILKTSNVWLDICNVWPISKSSLITINHSFQLEITFFVLIYFKFSVGENFYILYVILIPRLAKVIQMFVTRILKKYFPYFVYVIKSSLLDSSVFKKTERNVELTCFYVNNYFKFFILLFLPNLLLFR